MLTRLEIDGFKTFADFAIDVPPFLAVLGPNASGKSNLFDAIQFLRRLTEFNLTVASREARGDLSELFRRRGDDWSVPRISMAVEVLLNPKVRDPWGTEVVLTSTRLRYELTLERRTDAEGNIRLYVEHEQVIPIRRSSDRWVEQFKPSSAFLSNHFRDSKRSSPFLETTTDDEGHRIFRTRQDGVQGRARPAEAAEATVLSSMNSAEFKHLYALREEIVGWRFLQLDPASLRLPGERFGEDRLEPSGSNLARVLHRIRVETSDDDNVAGSLADISADLSTIVDGLKAIDVIENEQTRKWEIRLLTRDEGQYSSNVASDGTLRVLALLAALYDPSFSGLVCFEEPENGVHPLRLTALVRYLRELVTSVENDVGGPLIQMIVNSHSPVVLSAAGDRQAVMLDSTTLIEPGEDGGVRSRVSRVRRIYQEDQPSLPADQLQSILDPAEVHRYKAAALLGA